MMPGHGGGNLTFIITVAVTVFFIAVLALRNRAPRLLRPELMWIAPLIILLMGSSYFIFVYHPTAPTALAELAAAALVGIGFGWWRGKLTRIAVHPETHDISAQVSPVGFLLIIVVLLGRRAIEALAGPSHVAQISGLLIAFALGTVVAARVEMWLRARRLLAEAKAA
jgi:membrane protein CcdC involved in cytochrome C biogenesis